VEETKESFVILNCKNYTGDISPAYTIKIFKLESVDESDVVFTRIIEHPFNAKIFDAKIELSKFHYETYGVFMILERNMFQETDILLMVLN
jgi:hypothetical protein